MGVPGLQSFLRKRYPTAFSSNTVTVSHLYLDANALLYNIAEVTKKSDEIAQLLLDAATEYSRVYSSTVTISIDGPAHMGKIREQRARRFNYPPITVITKDESLPGSRQGEIPISDFVEWSPAMFSPGTQMMEQIHQYMMQHKGNILYSSFYEPGEGEHKIIADIRNLPKGSSVAIVGKDADLLLLGMILVEQEYDAWIIRHNDTSEGKVDGYKASDPLWNINCSSLRQQILKDINKKSIWEFILALMIIGNDFIPTCKDTASLRDVAPLIIQSLKQMKQSMYMNSTVQWNVYIEYLRLLNSQLQDSTESQSLLYYSSLTPFPAREDTLVSAWKTTVEWNTRYYEFGLQAASIAWQYPIFYSPTLYSLLKHLSNVDVIPTPEVPPLLPYQALAAVLPPWLRILLPINIRQKLQNIPQYFPYAFQLVQKPGHQGDGIPLIPNIPYDALSTL